MATSKLLRRAYDTRLADIGLNLSEACLLAYVAEHGPLTQTQVAERIGMGRAPAGAIIDNLSARGLLVRLPHETDRRVWLLEATRPGVELTARIADVDLKLRSEFRDGLTRAERQQLAGTLIRLQQNLARVLGETAELARRHGLWAATMSSARSSGARNDSGTGGPQLYRALMSVQTPGSQSWSSTMQSMSA
jgi:MarR family transcriptional regulator, transcriptional regulator for hemolysin